MSELPKKIIAWVNSDGTTQFEGGSLFPKGLAAHYVDENLADLLAERLQELVTCVEDGCLCSEMKMAAAIDGANEAIRKYKGPIP